MRRQRPARFPAASRSPFSLRAAFTGKVQLLDLDPPNSYRIAGEGQGGVAGFAKGGANVSLTAGGTGSLTQTVVGAKVTPTVTLTSVFPNKLPYGASLGAAISATISIFYSLQAEPG